MTSNVGSSAIAKGRHNSIGLFFQDDKETSYSGLKSMVMEELRQYFRPELLNRIDEVVVFQSLDKSQVWILFPSFYKSHGIFHINYSPFFL